MFQPRLLNPEPNMQSNKSANLTALLKTGTVQLVRIFLSKLCLQENFLVITTCG